MSWTQDWIETGRAAEKRAAATVHECGTQMAVGYSNLGIPITVCPNCSPSLVANGQRPVGDAWGFREDASVMREP